jgi:hypothetical protein
MFPPSQEISRMPPDSLLVSVSVCVVAMFAVFAAVLFWGDLQTRPKQLADSSAAKRRAF